MRDARSLSRASSASPYYLPRALALLCGGRRRRIFPEPEAHALCGAVRGVARIQLSLHNLFEDGLSQSMADVLRERFPQELVPRLVESSANIIEARALAHMCAQ